MKTECPECHQRYTVKDLYLGETITCSVCGRQFTAQPYRSKMESAKASVIQIASIDCFWLRFFNSALNLAIAAGIVFALYTFLSGIFRQYKFSKTDFVMAAAHSGAILVGVFVVAALFKILIGAARDLKAVRSSLERISAHGETEHE